MKGKIFVISAPSGAGKTTLCQKLVQDLPGVFYSVSYTTRKRRPGEKEGIDYYFISQKEFEKKIKKKEFAEWAEVYDNCYGTSAKFLKESVSKNKKIVLSLDQQGALQIKKKYPKITSLIAILPPSLEDLRKRLKKRGETQKEIKKRTSVSSREIKFFKEKYDYKIVNKDLDDSLERLKEIINSATNNTRIKTDSTAVIAWQSLTSMKR